MAICNYNVSQIIFLAAGNLNDIVHFDFHDFMIVKRAIKHKVPRLNVDVLQAVSSNY